MTDTLAYGEYNFQGQTLDMVNNPYVLDKLVMIESPLEPSVGRSREEHTDYARECVRDSILRGEAPFSAYLAYLQTGVLNHKIPFELKRAHDAKLAWLEIADFMAVYIDYGVSANMQHTIDIAGKYFVPITYRRLTPIQ